MTPPAFRRRMDCRDGEDGRDFAENKHLSEPEDGDTEDEYEGQLRIHQVKIQVSLIVTTYPPVSLFPTRI
jgi:hypothetical protein